MKCIINCNYPVDFTDNNSLASLLGFKNKVYGKGGFRLSNNININAVNSIKVLCNVANG